MMVIYHQYRFWQNWTTKPLQHKGTNLIQSLSQAQRKHLICDGNWHSEPWNRCDPKGSFDHSSDHASVYWMHGQALLAKLSFESWQCQVMLLYRDLLICGTFHLYNSTTEIDSGYLLYMHTLPDKHRDGIHRQLPCNYMMLHLDISLGVKTWTWLNLWRFLTCTWAYSKKGFAKKCW